MVALALLGFPSVLLELPWDVSGLAARGGELTVGGREAVRRYDVAPGGGGRLVREMPTEWGDAALAAAPDGTVISASGELQRLDLEAETARTIPTVGFTFAPNAPMLLSPNGRWLLLGLDKGRSTRLALIEIGVKARLVRRLPPHREANLGHSSIAQAVDDRGRVAFHDGKAIRWGLASASRPTYRTERDGGAGMLGLAFGAGGRLLALSGVGGLALFDGIGRREGKEIPSHGAWKAVGLPDGGWAVLGAPAVRFYDARLRFRYEVPAPADVRIGTSRAAQVMPSAFAVLGDGRIAVARGRVVELLAP